MRAAHGEEPSQIRAHQSLPQWVMWERAGLSALERKCSVVTCVTTKLTSGEDALEVPAIGHGAKSLIPTASTG